MEVRKVILSEDEIPRKWYNLLADVRPQPKMVSLVELIEQARQRTVADK